MDFSPIRGAWGDAASLRPRWTRPVHIAPQLLGLASSGEVNEVCEKFQLVLKRSKRSANSPRVEELMLYRGSGNRSDENVI
jgi:hypothetical protein